jgi:hypothetical protein
MNLLQLPVVQVTRLTGLQGTGGRRAQGSEHRDPSGRLLTYSLITPDLKNTKAEVMHFISSLESTGYMILSTAVAWSIRL